MKTKLKTITLVINDDPVTVICPGHVAQKVFNDAFKNEGWSERGGYKQKDLKYTYMVKKKAKQKRYNFLMKEVPPGTPGAKPYTTTPWD